MLIKIYGGICMHNEYLQKNSEKTLMVADNLIKIGHLLPQVKGHEPITIFEAVFYIFAQLSEGLEDGNVDNKQYNDLIQRVGEGLTDLPVYYHLQILRQFTNRYYNEILEDKYNQPYDPEEDSSSVTAVISSLVNETKRITESENVIFSPLEVIYLYIVSFISEDPIANSDEISAFEHVLRKAETQKPVILSYISRYEELYKEKLKKEALHEN